MLWSYNGSSEGVSAELQRVMHFWSDGLRTAGMNTRKPYPTDVSDEEEASVAPYPTLMTPTAPQRA